MDGGLARAGRIEAGDIGLETKLAALGGSATVTDGERIEGYASLFGRKDRGGDVVAPGAYRASLERRGAGGVRMLWQHDAREPIGVWEEIREDGRGLFVKGRLVTGTARGREAAALVAAGAIDGLSIGYRTLRAEKAEAGRRLVELDLWEVSLVTFPMLPEARVDAPAVKSAEGVSAARLRHWAMLLAAAQQELRQR